MSQFDPISIIRKKREKQPLTAQEITWLVGAYTRGEVADEQVSAFLMAGFLNGFSPDEAKALTESMLHSGIVLDLSDIPGRKVDKHSTGGVGDKLSLILAPIVAAAGVPVPMISGRGLGHTGGTLDKLQSIPGFSVDLDLDRYRQVLRSTGAVLIGQTAEIAPADRKLYALRDVTATVECIPLIASSIMSKKLAEGIDALVLDVKFGSGAFMRDPDDALKLAQTLVGIGEDFGKQTIAYLTDMDQPLGYAAGNWLEVEECLDCLRGGGPSDVLELSHLLSGTMIHLGGKASDVAEGIAISREQVASGAAWSKWMEIVNIQGGDTAVLESPERYPWRANYTHVVTADRDGFVQSMDTFSLGMATVLLGAGRLRKEDPVDAGAGFILHRKRGDQVKAGEPLITLHTNRESVLEDVAGRCRQAFQVAAQEVKPDPLVTLRVDRQGTHAFRLDRA